MGVVYNIAGRQVGAHIVSMATLGTFFGGTWLAMRGGNKDKKPAPPIKADSGEEEKFIQEFIKQAEEESKAKGGQH